jgi:predicted lactoylglutathione lyase
MPDRRAPIEEPMPRTREAGAEIVVEAGNRKRGYAGTFADPDGRADGFLDR